VKHVLNLLQALKRDEEGAALIEYTVLLAILLIAVIVVIGNVGTWVAAAWSHLCTTVSTSAVTCSP
jgi:pilus assembly protein Flp/PilA